jgi:hypothetical protein
MQWISDPVNLGQKKKNPTNEQIVIFRHGEKILVSIERRFIRKDCLLSD